MTLNRVDGDDVDMLVASYRELLHEVAGCELQSKFKDFTVESDRLDVLLYECMGHNKTYENDNTSEACLGIENDNTSEA